MHLDIDAQMETFQVEWCVRGHHIYKSIWSPATGEELGCKLEPTNTEDPYAVAVVRRSTVVGHVSQKISAACSLFLRRNSTICCRITTSCCFSDDLPQGGGLGGTLHTDTSRRTKGRCQNEEACSSSLCEEDNICCRMNHPTK